MTQPLVAVIGAGPGIGLAVCKRFAREGFRVAALCRPGDPPAAFHAAIEAEGGEALVIPVDLAVPAALRGGLDRIGAEMGFPDVLVFNASRGLPGQASGMDAKVLAGDLFVSVTAALLSVQWALPAMRGRGRGTLLFTGGGLALEPRAAEASLSIGKAALRQFALCLAQELAPEHLHAALVSVCGFVRPAAAFSPETVAEAFWALHLQGREEWQDEVLLRP